MKILIIEDQENLAKLIKTGLETEGFTVDYVLDGETGQRRIELYHDDYDAVIMDLMLPKRDGLEICKNIRDKKITTPVLMLTARDQNQDVINGLGVGADDYLIKPFSFDVLLARLRALLRRPKNIVPVELNLRGIKLDTTAKKAFYKDKEITLTLKEFSLLEYFMRHPNQVLNREQILSNLWDFAFDSFSNVVDVHITNLRKKLGPEGNSILESVYGIGYKFNN
ncbi:MAG: response regulator transcription factor [Candidatus Magasanikiibacteriota bacterium]